MWKIVPYRGDGQEFFDGLLFDPDARMLSDTGVKDMKLEHTMRDPCLVYKEDGDICGFIVWDYTPSLRAGYINKLYVTKSMRKKWIGRQLVESLIHYSLDLKIIEYLIVMVYDHNDDAIRFYMTMWFEKCGVNRHWYSKSDGTFWSLFYYRKKLK